MTSSIKPEVHHVSIRRQTDKDRARAMCNMHKKFDEDRTCSSEDDRGQTNTHTDTHRQAHYNTALPNRGRSNNKLLQ